MERDFPLFSLTAITEANGFAVKPYEKGGRELMNEYEAPAKEGSSR